MSNVFAVPVFFVVFRETIEAGIIVSVLLSFLKQTLSTEDETTYKRLTRQVWIGLSAGLFLCFVLGAAFIGAFYSIGKNLWDKSEDLWEGIFCLLACIIITIMGAAILRISKLRAKWQIKITEALKLKKSHTLGSWTKKYVMIILPLITVLREGLEAIVFVGGVSLSEPASAYPLPVVVGMLAGITVSWGIYRGGNSLRIQWFLIASTMLLYLVAAGLGSRAVWKFEMYKFKKLVGGDVGETGTGPGSYDIRNTVWHVNCCSPGSGGGAGWGIFNAILGWQNTATYGSVLSYNVYWIIVSLGFMLMLFREKRGHYPFMKAPVSNSAPEEESESSARGVMPGGTLGEKVAPTAEVKATDKV
ncbi:iron permease FTR1/Fip1/EfeU [Tuber borchii]|uniref:Iron permease FTR1/Fip1/EfeU n=1 Tax=Tuber borchii TaxID=42251 RepID=A0A2T7A7D9_TUBBO|nr:iron permease FTR1/Fip1/EfeU [Tuber borchii]